MASSSSTPVALLSVVTLGVLLAISPPARNPTLTSPTDLATTVQPSADGQAIAYVRVVASLLSRYDAAQGEADRLLTARDADPRLVGDARWRQDYGNVAKEHQSEYAEVQTLIAPANAQPIQTCLTDGMRLTATAEGMFSDAFGADGHHAYYLSAHGNWDLNLGKTTIARCRASFAAWQAKTGA